MVASRCATVSRSYNLDLVPRGNMSCQNIHRRVVVMASVAESKAKYFKLKYTLNVKILQASSIASTCFGTNERMYVCMYVFEQKINKIDSLLLPFFLFLLHELLESRYSSFLIADWSTTVYKAHSNYTVYTVTKRHYATTRWTTLTCTVLNCV